LLRAEIRSALGDHSGASADADAARASLGRQPHSLTPNEHARLHRVQGLAAADRGELDRAARDLDAARRIFLEVGNQAGVAAIDRDRLMVAVWQGQEPAVPGQLFGEPPQTVADYVLLAAVLRRQLRYEEAFRTLLRCAADHALDPALRWHVLYEMTVLLRLIRQDDAAQRLLPLLQEATAASADPETAAVALARLSAAGTPSDAFSPQFDRRVQHARRLITETRRLDEAESMLVALRAQAYTDRDIATWHLSVGELMLARDELAKTRSFAQDAVDHLSKAVDYSSATALVEVRVCALRSLGHAFDRLSADEQAGECWAKAHHLEEIIAGHQRSDDVRIGMLQAVPNEYDERIHAVTRKLKDRGPEATAAIVVAMEAARGASILGRILPRDAGLARDLPEPSDLHGAWRWVSAIADRLPRSQVVWIIHSTPDWVHHALLGRGLLYHAAVPVQRRKLTDIIDAHQAYWDENLLELSVAGGEFSESLQEVAAQVGISAVIPKIPPHVHRIAMVAGGELSDIPFAAMTVPGGTEPIGLRYALSDLPCLSARLPLHHRSRQSRGDRLLVVSPPADGLTRAGCRRARTVLDGPRATRAMLETKLDMHRYHQLRIDSHGQYAHHDPTGSWLQLAPAGPEGQLRADQLQWMDLRGCGTVVLGACESGMAHRIGRDERIGFVRAAVHAGAPAVIAARWVAVDAVAATMLDHFERYLRYLPRDLALQRAQFDVCQGAPGIPANLSAIDHPARWACWTLYGDSGWQTGAGPVRRSLRRGLANWRRRAAYV
jgi:tetratricopeptide (TPR) repeat protein